MRLIFLIEHPFGERDYDRFGVEILQAERLQVEVWDLTPLLLPRMTAAAPPPEPRSAAVVRTFATLREAADDIRSAGPDVVFMPVLAYSLAELPVLRALSASRARFGVANVATLPVTSRLKAKQRWRRALTSAPRLLNSLFIRTPPRAWGLRPASFLFAGSAMAAAAPHPLVGPTTELVAAHSLDYDLVLRAREEQPIDLPVASPYAVYLDQYWPYHSDWLRVGMPPPVDPDRYYAALRAFFERFEQETGKPVVVAVHPRARYDLHGDVFGGRPLISGRTAPLIRFADVVLAHDTTALNFANIYRKPVIFLKPELDSLYNDQIIVDEMAAAFGKRWLSLYDLPAAIDWNRELTVDASAYDRYREAFIKMPGTPERPSWAILAGYLLQTSAVAA